MPGRPVNSGGLAAPLASPGLKICPASVQARSDLELALPRRETFISLSSRPIAERPKGSEAEWRDPDALSCAMPHQGVLPVHSAPLRSSDFGNYRGPRRARFSRDGVAYPILAILAICLDLPFVFLRVLCGSSFWVS